MSSLLSVDVITSDFYELEANLKNEVNARFSNVVWDSKPYETDVDWGTYHKLYGAGITSRASSTRRCLDNFRTYKRELGESTNYIVGLR